MEKLRKLYETYTLRDLYAERNRHNNICIMLDALNKRDTEDYVEESSVLKLIEELINKKAAN